MGVTLYQKSFPTELEANEAGRELFGKYPTATFKVTPTDWVITGRSGFSGLAGHPTAYLLTIKSR